MFDTCVILTYNIFYRLKKKEGKKMIIKNMNTGTETNYKMKTEINFREIEDKIVKQQIELCLLKLRLIDDFIKDFENK